MRQPAFDTLVAMMAHRASATPDKTAYTFVDSPCRFGDLWRRAGRFAAMLMQNGIRKGDCVLLALPNGHDFFPAFFGTLRVGAVAVPIFPGSGTSRIASLASLCDARAIILPQDTPFNRRVDLMAETRIRLLDPTADPAPFDEGTFPTIQPDDLAYLQYTSGSTGDPKGVQISHRNVMANITQLIDGMQITPREVFVSWLPVYHDMGLILKTLVPFYLSCRLVLLPTRLTDVHTWLKCIHQHRATFTAAPDFAYRLLNRYVDDPGRYDLSSLRVALNAAEPVRAKTITAFERMFGLQGVMAAGYGLAEATVGVSMWPPQTPYRVDGRGFVSVGPPFRDVRIRIIDKNGVAAAPGEVGRIVVASPANTRGYYRNPEADRRLFTPDGDIDTGDLGYLDADGCLFVVGRRKNMINASGRTLAPQELEEIVDTDPRIRFSAAVGFDQGGLEGEQPMVFAEVRRSDSPDDLKDLAIDAVRRLHREIGVRPRQVVLMNAGTIPLTHNGKIRHAALRKRFLSGRLREAGDILFPRP
jgi:acyl-CoA synthetase (AMP-forming)/AMP-acid ligase II